MHSANVSMLRTRTQSKIMLDYFQRCNEYQVINNMENIVNRSRVNTEQQRNPVISQFLSQNSCPIVPRVAFLRIAVHLAYKYAPQVFTGVQIRTRSLLNKLVFRETETSCLATMKCEQEH